jgi:hypothetical protein
MRQDVNTHGANLSAEEQEKLAAAKAAEEKVKAEAEAKAAAEAKDVPTAIVEKAKKLFSNYPAAQVLHFTTDSTAFFEAADAKAHAAKQEDKTIYQVKRSE